MRDYYQLSLSISNAILKIGAFIFAEWRFYLGFGWAKLSLRFTIEVAGVYKEWSWGKFKGVGYKCLGDQ